MGVRFFACVLAVGCLSADSRSELIERDWLTPGDGLLTLDPSTGLEWLDLSQTLLGDFPGVLVEDRYQAVVTETEPGGRFEDFVVATPAQAETFAIHAGITPGIEPNAAAFTANREPTRRLIDLVGPTRIEMGSESFVGLVDATRLVDLRPPLLSREAVFVVLQEESRPSDRAGFLLTRTYRVETQAFPDPDWSLGVMLVRVVPEPLALAHVAIAAAVWMSKQPR